MEGERGKGKGEGEGEGGRGSERGEGAVCMWLD